MESSGSDSALYTFSENGDIEITFSNPTSDQTNKFSHKFKYAKTATNAIYEQFIDLESKGFIGYIVFGSQLHDTLGTNEAEKIDWSIYTDIGTLKDK